MSSLGEVVGVCTGESGSVGVEGRRLEVGEMLCRKAFTLSNNDAEGMCMLLFEGEGSCVGSRSVAPEAAWRVAMVQGLTNATIT